MDPYLLVYIYRPCIQLVELCIYRPPNSFVLTPRVKIRLLSSALAWLDPDRSVAGHATARGHKGALLLFRAEAEDALDFLSGP